jgi:hypothetical protein
MIVVGCQAFKEMCCGAKMKQQWRIKRVFGFRLWRGRGEGVEAEKCEGRLGFRVCL